MHLRNNNTLGTIDDKGTMIGHERNIAHEHLLFLDVFDGFGASIFIDIEHDQTQRHLQGSCVGHIALLTFLNVEFWLFKMIFDEFQLCFTRKVVDRENRIKNRLQSDITTPLGWLIQNQKRII